MQYLFSNSITLNRPGSQLSSFPWTGVGQSPQTKASLQDKVTILLRYCHLHCINNQHIVHKKHFNCRSYNLMHSHLLLPIPLSALLLVSVFPLPTATRTQAFSSLQILFWHVEPTLLSVCKPWVYSLQEVLLYYLLALGF